MFKYPLVLILIVCNISSFASSQRKVKGTLKIDLSSMPPTLNPFTASDYYSLLVHDLTYEKLLNADEDTDNFFSGIAREYTVSADELSYTFKIRPGIKWHDGKSLTVDDIKFSFDSIIDKDNTYKTAQSKSLYENLESVKIIDQNTIVFKMKKKAFTNLKIIASTYIIPKHIYHISNTKMKKRINREIVGSGPYQLKKYDHNKGIQLTYFKGWVPKHKRYEEAYNFKKIYYKLNRNSGMKIQRMERGDINYAGLNAEQFVKKTKGSKWGKTLIKEKVLNKEPKTTRYIMLNLKMDIFKERKVRHALAKLFNRKLMIEKFYYNMMLPSNGPTYLQSEFADPTVETHRYDPKLALEMLRSQGWKDTDGDQILDKVINGKKRNFSFTILVSNEDAQKQLSVYKEDAKKVGVNIRVKLIEWNAFMKTVMEKNYEAAYGGGLFSKDWSPEQLFHTKSIVDGGANFANYSNPRMDKLMDIAANSSSKEERREVLRKVYKGISEDMPFIWLFNDQYEFYGHHKDIIKKQKTFTYQIGQKFWSMKN